MSPRTNESPLTPFVLSEHPQLGLLSILMEALYTTRLALVAVHGGIHDDEYPQDDDHRPQDAYAVALLHVMATLADLLSVYRQSLEHQPFNYKKEDLTEESF
jgi:hypothetical protein